eukprot:8751854-Karenia_brevis.AAC.1
MISVHFLHNKKSAPAHGTRLDGCITYRGPKVNKDFNSPQFGAKTMRAQFKVTLLERALQLCSDLFHFFTKADPFFIPVHETSLLLPEQNMSSLNGFNLLGEYNPMKAASAADA